MGSNCRSLNFCRFIGKLKSNGSSYDRAIASSEIRKSRGEDTRIFPRSYYGGAPALYPAFDSISILASLAFLAFLLQSFAALFDRSRSIIPAVISSRDSSSENEPPDLPELILRALDEYFLNNDMDGNDEESSKKKSIKNRR
ncbi:uncharacterized protein [Fopius arisanus]|uniref:Uncharacterized protein n=1 Tax=Fopius arisanus TaxID=64838 RepID=A0A9R1TVI8_9HYME|nr:PREDICTED: uncharacterized protein LOC105264330 [Fopius arisanus]XP_011299442.1 PREDICTED: uncharacterized protein LOC105264330 [Fopius arisanus]